MTRIGKQRHSAHTRTMVPHTYFFQHPKFAKGAAVGLAGTILTIAIARFFPQSSSTPNNTTELCIKELTQKSSLAMAIKQECASIRQEVEPFEQKLSRITDLLSQLSEMLGSYSSLDSLARTALGLPKPVLATLVKFSDEIVEKFSQVNNFISPCLIKNLAAEKCKTIDLLSRTLLHENFCSDTDKDIVKNTLIEAIRPTTLCSWLAPYRNTTLTSLKELDLDGITKQLEDVIKKNDQFFKGLSTTKTATTV